MKYYAVLNNYLYGRFVRFKQFYGYKETMLDDKHHIVFYDFLDDTSLKSFTNQLPKSYVDSKGVSHLKQWLKPIDNFLENGNISEETFIEIERKHLNGKKG